MTTYAEDVNYWKTGTGGPDSWIEKAIKQIEQIGGVIHQEAYGRESGKAAYMLQFSLDGDQFKVIWPVLSTRSGKDELAAKRQAATMLFHDVKAKCVSAKILGGRTAFFSYYQLPDGNVVSALADSRISESLPLMLTVT